MPFMNIVLFGGAFNPPHLGHLLVIKQAFELIPNIDQLWLMPSHAHTLGKTFIHASHRTKMVELLCADLEPEISSKVFICPIEIDYQTSGETLQTIKLLNTEVAYLTKTMNQPVNNFNQIKYSFLMGSDQLASFHLWGNYQELLSSLDFYIYPRPNFPLDPFYPHMTALAHPNQVITNLSSTLIRNRIHQSQSLYHLLPLSVINYINNHDLYSS